MIRPATLLDLPAIIALGHRYVEEEVSRVRHHEARWEPPLAGEYLAQTVMNPDEAFLHVYESGDKILGFLWAFKHKLNLWSSLDVASDVLFYVVPECRGKYGSICLINRYKAWAKTVGCTEVRLSIASGINEERNGLAYQRLGFKPFGTTYNLSLED